MRETGCDWQVEHCGWQEDTSCVYWGAPSLRESGGSKRCERDEGRRSSERRSALRQRFSPDRTSDAPCRCGAALCFLRAVDVHPLFFAEHQHSIFHRNAPFAELLVSLDETSPF